MWSVARGHGKCLEVYVSFYANLLGVQGQALSTPEIQIPVRKEMRMLDSRWEPGKNNQ